MELLLVPRKVDKIHPLFPTTPAPTQRITLKLSDLYANKFRQQFNREPKFSPRRVGFGLEDDEVVVAAILEGSNHIPHWEFRSLLRGDTDNLMDVSSDAEASFGMMKWDLSGAASR